MYMRVALGYFLNIVVGIVRSANDVADDNVKQLIIAAHNKVRGNVGNPTASNMKKTVWSPEAASLAQGWANRCVYEHSSQARRTLDKIGYCGENLYKAMGYPPASIVGGDLDTWTSAVESWASEVKDYTYPSPNGNNGGVVGHYTQVVWADSYGVGCAYARCGSGPSFVYFVCNYCPGGNVNGATTPPYKQGAPCSACPADWPQCADGLCLPSGNVSQADFRNLDPIAGTTTNRCGILLIVAMWLL